MPRRRSAGVGHLAANEGVQMVMSALRLRLRLARWTARAFGWLTERLYHEWAWAYDAVAWVVSFGHWSQWRRAVLPYLAHGRVLEIGFGTGALLLEMRRRGFDAIGVDLSAAMQRITRRKARCQGIAVPTVRADARALPFAAVCFDSVVATFPAAYILSPALMAEVRRVLVPERGQFIVAGLYVQSSSPILKLFAWLVNGGDVQRAVSRFEQAATAAGFAITTSIERGRGFALPVFVLEGRAQAAAPAQAMGPAEATPVGGGAGEAHG
ncbi:MAG: class I SAM-dependent methyltransferase [Anaerolineae bacterium]